MPNTAAKRVIEAYLSREALGSALLVDAPWGSGKTHVIKQLTNCEADPTRLYVTLYDVHSPEAFDWALVRAMNPWSEGAAASWGKRAKELASGMKVFGVQVDMTKVNLTEVALRALPDTLIFDDIERCSLSHAQLSGLINRFVEHQNKRVILIANTEKHRDKDAFDAAREKLIGQTIALHPELDAAMTAVWGRIPAGQGRAALQARQKVVAKTFHDAGHNNLRLLLRAMRDAAVMLDALEPEMLEFDQAVDHLIATFLALHMAYHGGRLSKQDMLDRARFSKSVIAKVSNQDAPPPDALELVQKDHPSCNIEAGYSDILPVQLGYGLIVEGYASTSDIGDGLSSTHQFSKPSQQPDWVRLRNWYSEPLADLEMIIVRIKQRQASFDITEPGEILQIHATESFIQQFQEVADPKAHARKTYDYICALAKDGKIRTSVPSSDDMVKYGFGWELGRIYYGGYAFEPSRRDKVLARRLMAEMDKAFDRSLPSLCDRLLQEMRDAPDTFLERFEYTARGENFSQASVLHHLPVDKCAKILIGHHDENRDVARMIASVFAKRRVSHHSELSDEHVWFDQLETALIDLAKETSELFAAQIRLFIRRDLTAP
ncbi:hypothetical protein ROG8370_00543 [Roseovarius gaetbuli]|uniref:Uncharacterized protein n=1 Tax=Roseovarius gaetbuli TaxID=1356575 RepID=A0A1X6YDK0_9RHOB|nr:P-loop NTPase fold protein [Roseovarius gaetbuli]SLN17828.1 hypothetical protein ROG8370_00543 [Roseovarius gaetbuli]